MIEAIANAKLGRIERELELRGIRYDRPNDSWETRKSRPAERSHQPGFVLGWDAMHQALGAVSQ